jgi:hypothetical protein
MRLAQLVPTAGAVVGLLPIAVPIDLAEVTAQATAGYYASNHPGTPGTGLCPDGC